MHTLQTQKRSSSHPACLSRAAQFGFSGDTFPEKHVVSFWFRSIKETLEQCEFHISLHVCLSVPCMLTWICVGGIICFWTHAFLRFGTDLSPLKSVYRAEALLRTPGWQSVTLHLTCKHWRYHRQNVACRFAL